jgi:hypothetical protein
LSHWLALCFLTLPGFDGPASEKHGVPAERQGKLLFVGTEIKLGEAAPTGDELKRLVREGKYIETKVAVLVVEVQADEKVPAEQAMVLEDQPGKKYRLSRHSEELTPGLVRVALVPRLFRKLEVGDKVERGDLVALVNPLLAQYDLEITVMKFESAEAKRRAAEKTRNEAMKRYDALMHNRRLPVSEDDRRAAELTWERSIEAEFTESANVRAAGRQVVRALNVLKMYEVRADIPGVVRAICKSRGEAVKELETVVQIRQR